MPLKYIHIALSPNNTWKDTLAALGLLFPWNWPAWKRGKAISELEEKFRELVHAPYALAVGSGREALFFILKSLNLDRNDEVILQSFTCMVVTNSIHWNGLKPVYVDIDETFNLDLDDLNKKINAKTKVVIVQHTFGIPAQIGKIKKICQEKGLILIEDCAHALGATVDGKPVGSFGDLAFYSLGRSKVISCVNGGMIVCHNKRYLSGLKSLESELKDWSRRYILQNLMHPWVFSKAKLFYWSPLGKAIIVISQKLKLINLEVTPGEKKGKKPKYFVSRLANAMAKIALIQFKLLDKFNEHRRRCADYYFKNLKAGRKIDPKKWPGAIFLRYPILVDNPEKVIKKAREQGVVLGDWYSVPVAPADIDETKTGYKKGSCPQCESSNMKIINLPTYQAIKLKDLEKIVKIVNQYAQD